MEQSQADTIADIALSIPPNATSRDLLIALNRAYREGFRKGIETQSKANDITQTVIGRILTPKGA